MRAVAEKAKPERVPALLGIVLAGFLLLAGLPDDRAGVRIAGVSVAWWYAGLLAPGVAAIIAVLGAPSSRVRSEPAAGPPPPPR
jgi:hypothetical protein